MRSKTIKRTYRTEKLTTGQAARDEEIRRKVMAEFPPLKSASPLALAIR